MTDQNVDKDEAPEAEAEDKAKTTDEAPTTITLPDGKEYSLKEVLEWKDGGLRQADYTKKTQALAEEKKRLRDEIRSELEEEYGSREANRIMEDEPSSLDEYVPGLGKELAKINQAINQLTQAQQKVQEDAQKFLKDSELEEAWETAQEAVGKQPFADFKKIRIWLEERNLGPEHAQDAYWSLYGYDLGQAKKEAELKKRGADAPAPMRQSGLGLPQARAQDVPGAMKPVAQQSWQEVRNRAMSDPRKPRVD